MEKTFGWPLTRVRATCRNSNSIYIVLRAELRFRHGCVGSLLNVACYLNGRATAERALGILPGGPCRHFAGLQRPQCTPGPVPPLL